MTTKTIKIIDRAEATALCLAGKPVMAAWEHAVVPGHYRTSPALIYWAPDRDDDTIEAPFLVARHNCPQGYDAAVLFAVSA
jgi:hypothetical protein